MKNLGADIKCVNIETIYKQVNPVEKFVHVALGDSRRENFDLSFWINSEYALFHNFEFVSTNGRHVCARLAIEVRNVKNIKIRALN